MYDPLIEEHFPQPSQRGEPLSLPAGCIILKELDLLLTNNGFIRKIRRDHWFINPDEQSQQPGNLYGDRAKLRISGKAYGHIIESDPGTKEDFYNFVKLKLLNATPNEIKMIDRYYQQGLLGIPVDIINHSLAENWIINGKTKAYIFRGEDGRIYLDTEVTDLSFLNVPPMPDSIVVMEALPDVRKFFSKGSLYARSVFLPEGVKFVHVGINESNLTLKSFLTGDHNQGYELNLAHSFIRSSLSVISTFEPEYYQASAIEEANRKETREQVKKQLKDHIKTIKQANDALYDINEDIRSGHFRKYSQNCIEYFYQIIQKVLGFETQRDFTILRHSVLRIDIIDIPAAFLAHREANVYQNFFTQVRLFFEGIAWVGNLVTDIEKTVHELHSEILFVIASRINKADGDQIIRAALDARFIDRDDIHLGQFSSQTLAAELIKDANKERSLGRLLPLAIQQSLPIISTEIVIHSNSSAVEMLSIAERQEELMVLSRNRQEPEKPTVYFLWITFFTQFVIQNISGWITLYNYGTPDGLANIIDDGSHTNPSYLDFLRNGDDVLAKAKAVLPVLVRLSYAYGLSSPIPTPAMVALNIMGYIIPPVLLGVLVNVQHNYCRCGFDDGADEMLGKDGCNTLGGYLLINWFMNLFAVCMHSGMNDFFPTGALDKNGCEGYGRGCFVKALTEVIDKSDNFLFLLAPYLTVGIPLVLSTLYLLTNNRCQSFLKDTFSSFFKDEAIPLTASLATTIIPYAVVNPGVTNISSETAKNALTSILVEASSILPVWLIPVSGYAVLLLARGGMEFFRRCRSSLNMAEKGFCPTFWRVVTGHAVRNSADAVLSIAADVGSIALLAAPVNTISAAPKVLCSVAATAVQIVKRPLINLASSICGFFCGRRSAQQTEGSALLPKPELSSINR